MAIHMCEFAFCCWDKALTKNNMGRKEKGLFGLQVTDYQKSPMQKFKIGNWRQELTQRPLRENAATYHLPSLGLLSQFF